MPRAKAAEKPATKPAKKAATHALFPSVDPTAIASVWVYRLVRTRGNRYQAELLLGPADPASITNEAHLKAYGPGLIRVSARRSDGALLGDSYELRLPDEQGRVPLTAEDFERDEPGAAKPFDEAAMYKRMLEEQRAQSRELFTEMRAAHREDFATFGGLVDKVLEATSKLAPSATEPPSWFRDDMKEMKKELKHANERASENERELLKLKSRKSGESGGGLFGDVTLADIMKFAPGFLKELNSGGGGASAPSEPAGQMRATAENSCVIDGQTIPLPSTIADLVREHGSIHDVLSDQAVATLRRLHEKGMLPPAYLPVVGPVLAPVEK